MVINYYRSPKNFYTFLRLFLYLIINHPKDILFYFDWIESLRNIKEAPLEDRPWLTFRTIKWINAYLKNEMRVFEYGSGSSTLFFAERVKKLISIEHDVDWYRLLVDLLQKMQIENVAYILSKPIRSKGLEKNAMDPNAYSSGFSEKYQGLDFSEYVKMIDKYPDESFDLILIDGRSRPSCIKHAIRKLKQNGVIILDNSNRERYKLAEKQYLCSFKCKRFYGIGPYSTIPWETSIYYKLSSNKK